MCGRNPHSFPRVNMIITDVPQCCSRLFSSSRVFGSLFLIHRGHPVKLVSCICPLSTHCISLNIAKSVKELECSSNYQTLKGTGLIALNLVSPWLSSQQYRPCAFSVVTSSLSCFLCLWICCFVMCVACERVWGGGSVCPGHSLHNHQCLCPVTQIRFRFSCSTIKTA